MKNTFRLFFSGLMLLFVTSGTAWANLVEFKQVFPGGFNVSINGGAFTPSGPITIVGTVNDTAPDLDPGYNGEFALTSVTFTGAGFVNELVTTPLSLLVWGPDRFAFQLLGKFNQGITGWNGSSPSGSFIANVDDLTTLFGLPYTTTGTSTFWLDGEGPNSWTLSSANTIGGNIGLGGPDGTFSIAAVPEPETYAMLLAGLGLLGSVARRRKLKAV